VKELELPNPPAGLFHNMSWSPDGRYLATCNSYEASLRIFNTKDWSVAKDFGREDAGACQKPAFSDDGEELTVWGRDLTTFAVKDWHVLRRLKGTTVLKEGKFLKPQADGWDWKFRIRDMAYAPGSHHLVFAGGTYADETHDCPPASRVYTARIWVLQQTDSAIQRSLLVHCSSLGGDDATQLALHPTANRVAVIVPTYVRNGPIEPPIRILDLQNGQALDTALDENSEGFPTSLTYTPDGRYLLVGQNNGNSPAPVYVIDSRSLRVIDAVHAPGRVLAIAAHPKSTSFAAAAIDGLTVWKFVSF
jgi:WD40 repeat protein